MPETVIAVYVFIFGAVIGSFLNVVIHRYPLEESIVFPPSRCPNCGYRIKPWDNIPILSYIVLLGRCRSCRVSIAPRYPLVEAANGLFYAALYLHVGRSWALPLLAISISLLILLIYIDLDIQMLPDVMDKPGIIIGLLLGALEAGELNPSLVLSPTLIDSIIGAAAGWGVLYLVARLYRLLRGVEGMGQGDMKMLAMIGAICGWTALFPVLFLASATGAVFGITYGLSRKEGLALPLPFGVFLGGSTFVVIFFGHTLLAWYVRIFLPLP